MPILALMSGDSSSIGNAINWIAALLTGSLATAVAVIAVASLGFAAMRGQIHMRDYARVILGCFIIFGARQIAEGLSGMGAGGPAPSFNADIAAPVVPSKPPATNDPYAGASVPN